MIVPLIPALQCQQSHVATAYDGGLPMAWVRSGKDVHFLWKGERC